LCSLFFDFQRMRKTKYFIKILIALFIAFLLTGVVNKSVEFSDEFYINKPVKIVYFAMMNPMKMDSWVQGFERLESLDGFLNGPGSRYLLTLKIGKRKVVAMEEVTSFNWKEDLGLKFDFGHMILETMIEFREEGDGTRLLVKTKVTGNGILSKSIITFTKPFIRKHFNTNFTNLKQTLE